MKFARHRCRLALVGLLALTVAACSGEGPTPPKKEVLVPLRPAASSTAPPVVMVGAADSAKGPVAVDAQGRVLYTFDKDGKGGSKRRAPSCVGACATTWPPLLSDSGMPVALPGIDPTKLGIVIRKDGGKQVTLDGRPLYRHSGDTAPGQTTGDGKDGWHVASPKPGG
ncbi:COG4315 family predicted lipoprotein [Streptosporangium sp. OZ121]|uniref:COG4315 family predicted lipoprotein n=1 Tax=Streptosporangium sp. OZ121 TaxID=3444183 RepID=UPI003F7A6A37